MKRKSTKILKKALCYAVIMVMALTVFPLTAAQASAAGFDTEGHVKNLKAVSVNYNHIGLTWSAYSGAAGYQVYRATDKDGDYKLLGKTDELAYKCKATLNKTYYFKVRAYKKIDGKTKHSKYSDIVSKKTKLDKPVLSMSLYNTKVKSSWNQVKDASGYQVCRATSSKGKFKAVRKTKLLYYEDKSVKARKTYYYKVRAYKVINDKTYYGPYSAVMKGRTRIAEPINLVMTAIKGGLKISWHEWTNAKGYAVYRSTSADGGFTKIAEISTPYYSDKSLEEGVQYYYKIRSFIKLNGVKHYSDYSSTISGILNNGAPIVTVKQTVSSVKLSWPAVEDITGYEVYRATSPDGSYKKLGINTKSPTWENDELELNKIYYYKVRTYKKSGSKTTYGPYSIPVAGATKVQAPTSIKGNSQSNGMQVTWKKPTNAVGYEIKRATSENGTYTVIGTSSTTSFLDTDVTSGKKYYYKIRGYMELNGKKYNGVYSSVSATRTAVVNVALGWLGCKESDGSHKKIIDVYNSNLAPGCGKMTYTAAWCATYVSAVGIKAKATDIIVRHSYCPTMRKTYKDKGQYSDSKTYTPKPGDIIFYDWNKNGAPDHVGMIVSCSGSTVKAIEGNKNDAVGYRTFSKGYTYIQTYGLPKYSETGNGFKYTGSAAVSASTGPAQTSPYGLSKFSRMSAATSVTAEEDGEVIAADALEAAGIDSEKPDGYSDIGDEYDVAEKKLSVGCGEETTELEKMKFMIKTVVKQGDTSDLKDCTKSEYYAAFLYKLCDEADIDACIFTETNDEGEKYAWVEATLDGKLYKIDTFEDTFAPEEYTPEVTDCNITE